MWKDFFYYSKSERRTILFLLIIAVLGLAFYWIAGSRKNCFKGNPVVEYASVDSFKARLNEDKTYVGKLHNRSVKRKKAQMPVLCNFNPNTADSALLRKLGLSEFVTRNILRYRKNGGEFRSLESFSKIYGLSSEQYQMLRPYIRIPALAISSKSDSLRNTTLLTDTNLTVLKYPVGTVIDLNMADTFTLKRVPGIGSVLAKKIVAYRQRLGGFYSVGQLQEIHRIDTTFNKWFRVDSCGITRLEVNRASIDELRRHPYMDFYKAKAILEYRKRRGKIKSLSRLSLFEEFSGKDLVRLSPYLSFD